MAESPVADVRPRSPADLLQFVCQHAQDTLYAIPFLHSLLPACEIGIFRRVPCLLCSCQDERNPRVPHGKRKIRVGALVAHEPGSVGEVRVEDGNDADEILVVAIAGRRKELWVECFESVDVNEAVVVRGIRLSVRRALG